MCMGMWLSVEEGTFHHCMENWNSGQAVLIEPYYHLLTASALRRLLQPKLFLNLLDFSLCPNTSSPSSWFIRRLLSSFCVGWLLLMLGAQPSPSEKAMATHSSVLAWRIPGTGEPGGLPSMGLHRVRHDWSDLAAAAITLRLPSSSQKFPLTPSWVASSSFLDSAFSPFLMFSNSLVDHLLQLLSFFFFPSCFLSKNAQVAILWDLVCHGSFLPVLTQTDSLAGYKILFKTCMYLAASGLSCNTWDLHCIMQDLLFWLSDSLVVVQGLSCFAASGILVPQSGTEPASPALWDGFLTAGSPGKSLDIEF